MAAALKQLHGPCRVAYVMTDSAALPLALRYVTAYTFGMSYLTERQKQILEFIQEYRKDRGIAPTHREICERFGFSSPGGVVTT